MGLAIAVELEDGHPVNHIVGDEGKTLLLEAEALSALAEERGCPPIESFWYHGEVDLPPDFDGDPDWLAELVQEAGLPVRWFDPSDGLLSVTALQDGLDEAQKALHGALGALRKALELARQRGTRFHLAYLH